MSSCRACWLALFGQLGNVPGVCVGAAPRSGGPRRWFSDLVVVFVAERKSPFNRLTLKSYLCRLAIGLIKELPDRSLIRRDILRATVKALNHPLRDPALDPTHRQPICV